MSAIIDADRMRVRPSDPVGTVSETRKADDPTRELLSPELALVDPALARRARALLPDPVAAPHASAIPRPPVTAPTTPASQPPGPPAHARRKLVLAAISCLVAAMAVAVAWVRSGDRSPPPSLPVSASSSQRPAPVTPTPTSAAIPANPVDTPAAERQTFVWAPVANASGYEFQLFRGSARLFRARVDEPRLQLPADLPNGEPGTLGPGSYRWYVWAIQRRTGARESAAVVQARLTIEDESR
jgi:hypothetical protein